MCHQVCFWFSSTIKKKDLKDILYLLGHKKKTAGPGLDLGLLRLVCRPHDFSEESLCVKTLGRYRRQGRKELFILFFIFLILNILFHFFYNFLSLLVAVLCLCRC